MEKIVKEKLRALQCTQETINATADYLIENSADAKRLIKAWNEEFTNASVSRKLTLLYLANDVLQRCKTSVFLPGFMHYLPKATAHLYKHGNEKIRAAVDRLVTVWNERKVLKSQGMAAVRSQLEKVKDTPPVKETENDEGISQGNKRKRGMHPTLECLDEVEQAAKQRSDIEEAIAQIVQEREVTALSKEELMKLNMFYEQHYVRTKSEMRIRKKMVDLLRETLSEQENGLQQTKETLRLCVLRQEDVKKAVAVNNGSAIQDLSERRGSVSLSEENLEPRLLPPEDSSSSMNLTEQNHHSYETQPTMTYPVSVIHHQFSPAGHVCFAPHPNRLHSGVTFSTMPADNAVNKAMEHEIAGGILHQAHPFMNQGYMPDDQAPPIGSYDTALIHGGGIHSTYDRHQVNYGGYPSQYEPAKDWRT